MAEFVHYGCRGTFTKQYSCWESWKTTGKVGVCECWLVSPKAETVEVLQVSAEGITTVNISGIEGP
jgi:hypothetical protein